MSKKQKVWILIDVMVVILLFIITCTDFVWQERKVHVSNIAVWTDLPQNGVYLNFREGAKQVSTKFHADLHFFNFYDSFVQQIDISELVQRELSLGCEGILLQCTSKQKIEMLLQQIPLGIPIVIYGMEIESPKVKYCIVPEHDKNQMRLVQEIAQDRTQGQTVTLVAHKYCEDSIKKMYEQLETLFLQEGIVAKTVFLSEYAEAEALSKGLAAQKGNMVVCCDAVVLEELSKVCTTYKLDLPVYGMGWSGEIRKQLECGSIDGILVEDSYTAGLVGVEQLTYILTGKKTDTTHYTIKTAWVTPDTLYDRTQETILFPFI